ncbi:MAG: YicC/YloC family endoribonuclease [Cyclobacteriaceae bacterium]|nr:YicC family protein [Cyclobacteriaceae bacterium]HQQ81838.1 YicC family protein [Cyclobacteriaceae bacterium]
MIKSMTGFGQSVLRVGDATFVVEIKTLNSKFFDLSLRLPKIFLDKELEVRALVTDKLERGKVSVSVEYLPGAVTALKSPYDKVLFAAYYEELKKLADLVKAPHDGLFEIALRSPDVQQNAERETVDPALMEKMMEALQEALVRCDQFRATEGASLTQKFTQYIQAIGASLLEVEKLDPLRIDRIRSKIKKGITDFFGDQGFDPNRLEQEIIFYIEKLDIHEERVRLKTHLDYFITIMKESSNGKKLGFLAQEIGREINTIGSKANDAAMQKHVVAMKEELEKIKEQLNNVL